MSEPDTRVTTDANKDPLPVGASPVGNVLSNMYVWFAVGVLIIASAVAFKYFGVGGSLFGSGSVAHAGSQNVIVIDTGKIISAATKSVMSSQNTDIPAEGARLSRAMNEAISQYRDAGYLILNSYSVIFVPPEMDKTAEVAAKIGVNLE